MLIILLASLLVLGIAFYQVTQGLFSALIMAILAVLCASAAMGFYEPLAAAFLYSRQPGYADAVVLIVLFVVPLLALRWLLDWLIRDNVVLGVWADRIGGGVLGLIAGMVMVGVLLTAMQMLPFNESVLGFRPFDESLHRNQRIWPFYPDEFVVGLAKRVSGGGLKGDQTFASVHDDLLRELYCARNTAGMGGRSDARGELLKVPVALELATDAADWLTDVPANPDLDEMTPTRLLVVRAVVDYQAREPADASNFADWWLLPATQFRLVCRGGNGVRSYYPLACLTYRDKPLSKEPENTTWKCIPAPKVEQTVMPGSLLVGRPRQGKYTDEKNAPDAKTLTVDWVYRLAAGDVPETVIFRRLASVRLPVPLKGEEAAKKLQSPDFTSIALDRIEDRAFGKRKK